MLCCDDSYDSPPLSLKVNLHDWNPFYFDFGMAFVKLVAQSDEEARYAKGDQALD